MPDDVREHFKKVVEKHTGIEDLQKHMNVHKIFTDGAVSVDKSQATEEAPCGAVLPSMYSKEDKDVKDLKTDRSGFEASIVMGFLLGAATTVMIFISFWGLL
jgi:hypothetical protein